MIKYLSPKNAENQGYKPLTIGYSLPKEQEMFKAVVDDLNRGDIPIAFVRDINGNTEIWRSKY